jgi:hypothetical protein
MCQAKYWTPTRLQIEYLLHEFAGQVSEFVDSFRRRVRDLLAFEATSRDHFVIFAHRSNDTRENLFAWN